MKKTMKSIPHHTRGRKTRKRQIKTDTGETGTKETVPVSESGYCYRQLSVSEQALYVKILQALLHSESDVPMDADIQERTFDKVFQWGLNDHPEIFYVDGFTIISYKEDDVTTGQSFSGRYVYTREEIGQRRERMETVVQGILREIEKGADEYMLKPLNWDLLLHRISELLDRPDLLVTTMPSGKASSVDNAEGLSEEERIKQSISSLFLRIGIPAHLLGFRFAQDAIAMLVDDPMLMKNRTKVLYPVIAEKHHTSAFCVERAIRHVIALTWERGIAERYRKERGSGSLHLPLDRPTSGEFIALIADKLQLQLKNAEVGNF